MLESLKEISSYMALSDQAKQALVTTHSTPLFFSGGTGLQGLGLGRSGTGMKTGGGYGQPGSGGIISGFDGGNDLVGMSHFLISNISNLPPTFGMMF